MIMPADLEWRLIYILVSCQEYSSRVRLMQTDFANVCFFDLSNHDIMRMPTCPGLELHFPAKIVAREKMSRFIFCYLELWNMVAFPIDLEAWYIGGLFTFTMKFHYGLAVLQINYVWFGYSCLPFLTPLVM